MGRKKDTVIPYSKKQNHCGDNMPPIIPDKKIMQRKKPASGHDLEQIVFPTTVTAHKLTPLERRWFGFFVSVAKLGHSKIRVPIGKLTQEEYRVNAQTCSERTTYRALDGLASKGIIQRSTVRYGNFRFQTTIIFNEQAFSWYLKRTFSQNTNPTQSHICTHPPNWQNEKVTSNTNKLPVTVTSICYSKKQDIYQKIISSYLFPILITLRAILPKDKSHLWRRAGDEMASGEYVSGIDWPYWAERWKEFDHSRRDTTAWREIVPALECENYGHATKNQVSDNRLERIVQAMCCPVKESRGDPPHAPPKSDRVYHPDLLSRAELDLLEKARDRIKQKAG